MVQLHLLVVEGQREGQGAQGIPAQTQPQHPPQGQAQAQPVVPDRRQGPVLYYSFISSSKDRSCGADLSYIAIDPAAI